MKSPIRWFGGKFYQTKNIVPYIENTPHVGYVEVFGGGASILFAKNPSKLEVFNDLNSDLVNFF